MKLINAVDIFHCFIPVLKYEECQNYVEMSNRCPDSLNSTFWIVGNSKKKKIRQKIDSMDRSSFQQQDIWSFTGRVGTVGL